MLQMVYDLFQKLEAKKKLKNKAHIYTAMVE